MGSTGEITEIYSTPGGILSLIVIVVGIVFAIRWILIAGTDEEE
jgi:hypothetical protein